MTSGTARCRPVGRAAEGHVERPKRDEEEALKVRRLIKENNYCGWAEMSVAIEPTSSES